MRIAFAADIHANLPAFRAVASEIDRLGPFDRIINGGDVVLGGLYPGDCVGMLIDLGWEGVIGNADEIVIDSAMDGMLPKAGWPDGLAENEALQAMARWTAGKMSHDQIDYLASLPLRIDVAGPSGKTLAFVHATPWGTFPIVWQDADDAGKVGIARPSRYRRAALRTHPLRLSAAIRRSHALLRRCSGNAI
ncbi:MAG: metallophosphoesterase family protein [Thermomicrobiales bacterium]